MQTICAISTPYGKGGIAVIRISGDEAFRITDTFFKGRSPLREAKANTCLHGWIVRDETTLDEVVVSLFRAPHSFTGEDVVEIACHGSLFIQQELVRWLIEAGCRMAKGGEFTQRAFLNGRMDLTQAEAVADLIAAETKAEKDLALSQLRGGVSDELRQLRESLLKFTSLIELELDFADHEELEFADRHELASLANTIHEHLNRLTSSFRTGNAIKNGIPVAIVGKTNAGKSTLLNALVGEDRAIVSEIDGTTRDTIEERLIIDGQLFRLIDTAGLRETNDKIERLGIERSQHAIENAQIVLEVADARFDMPNLNAENVLHVFNKCDLIDSERKAEIAKQFPNAVFITAKQGEIADLKERLSAVAHLTHTEGAVISSARHYEALCRAKLAIERVQAGLEQHTSGEFLSMDLEDCLNALGEITGQITNQEVLNNIFSKFCIGK